LALGVFDFYFYPPGYSVAGQGKKSLGKKTTYWKKFGFIPGKTKILKLAISCTIVTRYDLFGSKFEF
jgi:hypothetical protein